MRTTLLPLSPPISRNMTYQNRYASLLPEAESFDAMAGVNEDTADEEWAELVTYEKKELPRRNHQEREADLELKQEHSIQGGHQHLSHQVVQQAEGAERS